MRQALTIAGSDSSGGAGIQADLKTFAAFGVYGASVLTAITAQNTQGVAAVEPVSPGMIGAQLDAVLSDLDIAAVKIGMVGAEAAIAAVAAGLARWPRRPVVLDPVMIAKGGAPLLPADAVAALAAQLVPLCDVLTPNLPEAAALLGEPEAATEAEMARQATALLALGPRAVLLKGGHGTGPEAVDLLAEVGSIVRFAAPRLPTRHTHGTGCTLSAAIAAGLATGMPRDAAIGAAKRYVSGALAGAAAMRVGHGIGPIDHFHHRRGGVFK